jgi:hypothetical protein
MIDRIKAMINKSVMKNNPITKVWIMKGISLGVEEKAYSCFQIF